jgi:Transposase DDE domain
MFCNRPQNTVSLEAMATDLYEQNQVSITKQAIQERFNNQAVSFMNSLLKHQLSRHLPVIRERVPYHYFKRVRLKDSTRFSLPKQFACLYKGHGGTSGPAQISIQYEYDLLTHQTIHLELTSTCRNDQQDAKETLNDIEPSDLLIRDLGYVSVAYIQHVNEHQAYYLNRLNPRTTVYDSQQNPIDLAAILNKIRKYGLTSIELEIFFKTHKGWMPSRLVLSPVDEKTYRKRMEKAKQGSLIYRTHRGYQISEPYKVWMAMNVFITNVPAEWLTAQQVIQTYRLRWQIELVFKVWKSQVHIKPAKTNKKSTFSM